MIIGILRYYSSKGVLPYGNDSFFLHWRTELKIARNEL